MAFPVFASMFITFGIVMNWRSALSVYLAYVFKTLLNRVAPGMGYVVVYSAVTLVLWHLILRVTSVELH